MMSCGLCLSLLSNFFDLSILFSMSWGFSPCRDVLLNDCKPKSSLTRWPMVLLETSNSCMSPLTVALPLRSPMTSWTALMSLSDLFGFSICFSWALAVPCFTVRYTICQEHPRSFAIAVGVLPCVRRATITVHMSALFILLVVMLIKEDSLNACNCWLGWTEHSFVYRLYQLRKSRAEIDVILESVSLSVCTPVLIIPKTSGFNDPTNKLFG